MSSSSSSSSPATFVTQLLASLSSHPPPLAASSTHSADTDAAADHNTAASHPPDGSLHLGHASAAQTSTTSTSPPNPLQHVPDAARKQLLTLHVLFPNEFLPALDLLDRGLVTRLVIAREDDGQGVKDASAGDSLGRASGDDARTDFELQEKGKGKGKQAQQFVPENSAHVAQEHPDSRVPHPEKHMNDPSRTPDETAFYLVRSAQPAVHRPSRHPPSSTGTAAAPPSSSSAPPPHKTYQVRLPPWTCTCPAFAFAAFPALPAARAARAESRSEAEEVDARWFFSALAQDRVERADDGDRDWVFGGVAVTGEAAMPPVCKHLLACVLGERCALFGGFVRVRRVGVEEAVGWGAGWGD